MTRLGRARAVAGWTVVGVACILPWLYAGTLSWTWRAASGGLGLAFGLYATVGGGAERFVQGRPLWFWPAASLCLWTGLQLVPLPPTALRTLSPAAAARLEASVPGYGAPAAPRALDGLRERALSELPAGIPAGPQDASTADLSAARRAPRWHPLSIAPPMTAECLVWYVALFAGALTLEGFVADERSRRAASRVLLASLGVLAAVALVQIVARQPTILWFRPVPGATPIGPYVNARHFAGAMEMAVPWLAAIAVGSLGVRGRRDRWSPAVWAVLATVAFAAGLGGQSKLAAVTMALGLSLLALTAVRRERRGRTIVALAAAWVLGGALVLATPLGERYRVFASASVGSGEGERTVMWHAMMPALRSFWLTGSGYGTFRWLAPAYIPAGDGGRWLQLHSDWLESTLSGGIVGALGLAATAAAAAVAAFRRWRALRESGARLEQLGCLLGLASLTVHAAVDFNHQIPANALLFVTLGVFATSEAGMGRERR